MQEVKQLKELWKICFHDSDTYINHFFNSRFKKENVRYMKADGKIISMAQFFPYEITSGRQKIQAVYILGVGTHPDYRGKGYSKKILEEALSEQRNNGTELAFLIPQEPYLFDIYRKYGFSDMFYVYDETLSGMDNAVELPYTILKNIELSSLYEFYSDCYYSLPSAALKTFEDFSFAINNYLVEGHLIICSTYGKIQGFAAFEHDGDNSCFIKELLCHDLHARETILDELFKSFRKVKIYSPNDDFSKTAQKKPLGMGRVLRPAEFLEKTNSYQKRKAISIQITDPFIPENSGVYKSNRRFMNASALELDISVLPGRCLESYANLLLN